MPVINIKEIDRTSITVESPVTDNIVFVPGTAITGPSAPTLCATYEEFTKNFGSKAPSSSSYGTTWEYAANMILAGFPVLFQRITTVGDTISAESARKILYAQELEYSVADVQFDAEKFSAVEIDVPKLREDLGSFDEIEYTAVYRAEDEKWIITLDVDDAHDVTDAIAVTLVEQYVLTDGDSVSFTGVITTVDYPTAHIVAVYPGSYGNNISVKLLQVPQTNYIYLQTFLGNTVAETIRVSAVGDTNTETYNNFVEAVEENDGITTDYIKFTIDDALTEDRFIALISAEATYTLEGGTDITDEDIIDGLIEAAELNTGDLNIYGIDKDIADKFVYDLKFITSGGLNIPKEKISDDSNIYKRMVELAQYRGDCVAVLDANFTTVATDMVNGTDTYFSECLGVVNSSYATAFAPWMFMSLSTDITGKWMAPSYVFLHQLARSVGSGNPIWQTPAGVNRGSITEAIKPAFEIGSAILDTWQNTGVQFINPIMKLRQYGYVLFGNRTLYKYVEGALGNRSALQELSVRMVAVDIKRAIIDVALGLTFESNTYLTWLAFRSGLEPTLSQMKVMGGLIDYEIIMDETTTTEKDIANNTVNGIVRVNIARAAENFEISFELAAAGVTFGSEL